MEVSRQKREAVTRDVDTDWGSNRKVVGRKEDVIEGWSTQQRGRTGD